MTQPATFTTTKLRRGMIFPRIRVGDVKPWEMGGKAMCHLPLSYPTTTIKKLLLLVGAVMAGGGVWQDCQSLPTHTLHQQVNPHDGRKTTTPSLHADSPLFHSLCDCMEHPPTLPSLLISCKFVLFPHAPFDLLYWWFLMQRRRGCWFGH